MKIFELDIWISKSTLSFRLQNSSFFRKPIVSKSFSVYALITNYTRTPATVKRPSLFRELQRNILKTGTTEQKSHYTFDLCASQRPPCSPITACRFYTLSFSYTPPTRVGVPPVGRYLADDLLRVHSSEVSGCRVGFNDVAVEMLSDLFQTVPLLETMRGGSRFGISLRPLKSAVGFWVGVFSEWDG